MAWYPIDEPWQYRVLDALPSGIDHAQLERARSMTPEERFDAAIALIAFGETMRDAMKLRLRTGKP